MDLKTVSQTRVDLHSNCGSALYLYRPNHIVMEKPTPVQVTFLTKLGWWFQRGGGGGSVIFDAESKSVVKNFSLYQALWTLVFSQGGGGGGVRDF